MAGVKSLMKDTAIYGVSSIVGRILNWGLVPLYTRLFPTEEYGIVTNIYAYVAVVLVMLLYGMETGFFRFANHDRWRDPMQVYSTTLISVGTSSLAFLIAIIAFAPSIASTLNCGGHSSFILLMGAAVAIDAFSCIPFAYLRYRRKALRFATLKFINIGLNIGLNLFFLLLCPIIHREAPGLISWFYDPQFGIGYIFLSNFIASLVVMLLLLPQLRVKFTFSGKLWKEMVIYSYPLLILGVAGIMNQTIDKILYPILITDPVEATRQLGIYGACYKIAIIMVMFLQAFRYAFEPFIFARDKGEGDSRKQAYADAMKYFIIVALFIFMGVMFFMPVLRYFISPAYFEGLKVVPVIMMAELFFGIFFNLSLWYKLTDRTIWGTWFSLGGLAITLAGNIIFVPHFGYMACAWSALACYGAMMTASYLIGQHYYPIAYGLKRIGAYFALAMILWGVGELTATPHPALNYGVRILLLLIYLAVVAKVERPLQALRRHSR